MRNLFVFRQFSQCAHRRASRMLVLSLLLASALRPAAQPVLNWDRTFGGTGWEEMNGLQVLKDGIVIGGSSSSNATFGDPADFSLNILLMKLNFEGQVIWKRMFGGKEEERLWALIPTSDGGLMAGGYSKSGPSGQKQSLNKGDADVWLVKLDATGQIVWEKSYGGSGYDELFDIIEMPDGNFVLACHSRSPVSGDKTAPTRGFQDFWVLGVDPRGTLLWETTIGGDEYEQIHDVRIAPDGNLLLSGGTTSRASSGELGPESAQGGMDFLLVKMNPATRRILWTRRYGGDNEDYPYTLLVSRFDKIYIGGASRSPAAAPNAGGNNKTAPFYGGNGDFWLLELDMDGRKRREWSFGGTGHEDLYYIHENEAGQLALGGFSDSGISGNKTLPGRGQFDYWMIGLDASGRKQWETVAGGAKNDALTKVNQLPNGEYLFGGHSISDKGGEKSQDNLGGNDFWLLSSRCATTLATRPPDGGGFTNCTNQPVTVMAEATNCPGCEYTWNTGTKASTLTIQPGTKDTVFAVLAMATNGCFARDTAIVRISLGPTLDLGPSDTLAAAGSLLRLGDSLTRPGWRYRWNTGAVTPVIQASRAGTYAVTVTDQAGCSATDVIRVEVPRNRDIWMPNAFSPNGDGQNDELPIFTEPNVKRIVTFQVADRWGALLFRLDDATPAGRETPGWDGFWRSQPVDTGVYIWFAVVEYANGKQKLFEGDVTVVK